jgi:hypothetical protein
VRATGFWAMLFRQCARRERNTRSNDEYRVPCVVRKCHYGLWGVRQEQVGVEGVGIRDMCPVSVSSGVRLTKVKWNHTKQEVK